MARSVHLLSNMTTAAFRTATAADLVPGDTLVLETREYAVFSTMPREGFVELRIAPITGDVPKAERVNMDATLQVETKVGHRWGDRFDGERQRPFYSHNWFETMDPKQVQAFLKGNSSTMGFRIQYATRADGETIEVFTGKGGPTLKVIAALIANGFTRWSFSWAWAPSKFTTTEGEVKAPRRLDCTTLAEIAPWIRALGGSV